MGCVASRPTSGDGAGAASFSAGPAAKLSESTQDSSGRAKPVDEKNPQNAAESSLLALAMDATAGGTQTPELVEASDIGTLSDTTGPTPSTVMFRAKQPFESDNDHHLDEVTSNSILADVTYSMREQSKPSSATTVPLIQQTVVKKPQALVTSQSNTAFLAPMASKLEAIATGNKTRMRCLWLDRRQPH